MASIFSIKQGDRKPYLRATLKDGNDQVISLTGCTVKFYMRRAFDQPAKVSGSCVIINEAGGIVEYQWGATDTSMVGDFMAEFEVTYADATKLSVPNANYLTVKVLRKLNA